MSISSTSGLALTAGQVQRQHLNAKQLQTVELLALPRQDMEALLAAHPLIEIEENDTEDFFAAEETAGVSTVETEDESLYEAQSYEDSADLEDYVPSEEMEGLEEYALEEEDEPPSAEDETEEEESFGPDYAAPAEENSNDFLDFTAAPAVDFREELLQELNTYPRLNPKFKSLCQYIIALLDDNGLLRLPLPDLAQSGSVSLEETEKALLFLQTFDPPGVAARSVQESWCIQLKRKGELTPAFEKLLTDLIDDLGNNRLPAVAQKLSVSMEELQQMLKQLASLNQYPVSAPRSPGSTILPETEIVPDGKGGFTANLLREKKSYKLWEGANTAARDAGADFMEKLREGKQLLEAFQYRKSTLLRMTEMLIDVQRAFLESGAEFLKPYTMREAAEYLDLSESTVSRTAAEKYVRTPWGVLPFKFFFTAGYVDEAGASVSRVSDMEYLKKLIDEEDKRKPLSDEKLSQLLNEAGHQVARRTVAKYREKMNIPSATLRKEFF